MRTPCFNSLFYHNSRKRRIEKWENFRFSKIRGTAAFNDSGKKSLNLFQATNPLHPDIRSGFIPREIISHTNCLRPCTKPFFTRFVYSRLQGHINFLEYEYARLSWSSLSSLVQLDLLTHIDLISSVDKPVIPRQAQSRPRDHSLHTNCLRPCSRPRASSIAVSRVISYFFLNTNSLVYHVFSSLVQLDESNTIRVGDSLTGSFL